MSRPERTSNLEIELKLAGDPAGLDTAWKAPLLERNRTGPATTKQLAAVYYDTPKFDLKRNGIALRVRTDGEEIIQTLKAAAPRANGIRRREWNARLAQPSLDLDAFKGTGAQRRIDGLENLSPVFETRISRLVSIVHAPVGAAPATVEVVLDRGEIKSAQSAAPVAEIELELLDGDPAAIFDLALALSEIAPLRVETRTKGSRGWDLVTGARPGWARAEPITLDRKMQVDAAIAVILGNCFAHWLANQAAAIDGGHPEGVHQLRVALRRLRSSLSIFGKAVDPAATSWIRTEARWVLQSLADARDLDVFLQELVAPVMATRPDDEGLSALRLAAETARDRAYEGVRQALTSPRYTRFLLRFGAWLERHGWRGERGGALGKPVTGLTRRWLGKTHARTVAAGRGFAELTPEARHEIRLSLKKLRYASECFQTLYPKKRTVAYVKRLRKLQDGLGHLNDLATAELLVERVLGQNKRRGPVVSHLRYGGGVLVGWYAHHAQTALQRAAADWDSFVAAKPYWE